MAPSLPLSDCLCWALYHPKVHNNNKDGTLIRQLNEGILWPAKRVTKEVLYGRVIHTISFLGRPVDAYVNADESEMKNYINGLSSFTKRRECRDFTQQFISLCASSCGDGDGDGDDNRGKAITAAAFVLFQDFYKALDEAAAIYCTDDDMDDTSQDDSDIVWASKAQQDWDDRNKGYWSGKVVYVSSTASMSSLSSQNADEDEGAVVPVADVAFAAPYYLQQQEQEQKEYHHNNEHHNNDDDIAIGLNNDEEIDAVVFFWFNMDTNNDEVDDDHSDNDNSMGFVVNNNIKVDNNNNCIGSVVKKKSDIAVSNNSNNKRQRLDNNTNSKTIMEDTSVPKDGNSTASSSSSNSNNNNNDDDDNNNNGNKRQCTVSDRDVIPIAINVTNTNSNGSNSSNSNSKRKRKRKQSSMSPLCRTEKEKRESQSPSIQQRLQRSSSSSLSVPTNRNKNTLTSIWRDCLSVASKSSMSVSLSQDGVVPVDVMCGTRNEKGKSGSNESNYPSSSSGTANASRPPRFPTPSTGLQPPPQSSSSLSVPTNNNNKNLAAGNSSTSSSNKLASNINSSNNNNHEDPRSKVEDGNNNNNNTATNTTNNDDDDKCDDDNSIIDKNTTSLAEISGPTSPSGSIVHMNSKTPEDVGNDKENTPTQTNSICMVHDDSRSDGNLNSLSINVK